MKKISAFLLALMLLFLCACSDKGDDRVITADMLNITNTDKDFQGCLSRFEAVLSAMSAKISILEEAHNKVIRSENKNEYFLDENYILTSFEPFIIETLSITEGFTADMTNQTAQDYYKLQSEGMDISFSSDGANYELTFVSETASKSYTAEYDEETDSLRYTYAVEDGDEETVEEFLEFSKTESGAYVIQSRCSRCYIEFNKNDEIVYFCCGTLYDGEFTPDESIYPEREKEPDGYWVISRGKSSYSGIHTFEDNVLIHEDRSGGPWKTVRINGENFASAFLE
ncbi:MAG: hypothetical protein IKU08_02910 [Clostridia bacterium]|nr:hypothetical protein [Clostridia bacterium]